MPQMLPMYWLVLLFGVSVLLLFLASMSPFSVPLGEEEDEMDIPLEESLSSFLKS